MAELVGEDADAAVLGLDGVVADPVVAAADRHAAERVRPAPSTSGPCAPGSVGIRAVAPDGVGALGTAAGLLALAGMHRLEVVDVAVRLVEVAVAVVVVAIPDVERREERVRSRGVMPLGELARRTTLSAWSSMNRPMSRVQTMLPQ